MTLSLHLAPPHPQVLALWCHETCRIISDRMWDPTDKEWLKKQLDDKLGSLFAQSYSSLFEPYGGEMPPFVTFLKPGLDVPAYEPVKDMGPLKDLLMEKLEDYALEPGQSAMDLVLFR